MKVKLNNLEIKNLLKNNILKLENGNLVEILSNELIVNKDGMIYSLTNAILTLKKINIEQKYKVEFLKELVSNHLNLERNQILLSYDCQGETVFRIDFFPDKELYIIVCHSEAAATNSKDFITGSIDTNSDKIGLYTRLSNSEYFFRWSDFI